MPPARQNKLNRAENQPIIIQDLVHAPDAPPTHLRKNKFAHTLKMQNAGIIDHSRIKMASLKELCDGLPIDPLPSPRDRDNSVPHAPVRTVNLSADERRV